MSDVPSPPDPDNEGRAVRLARTAALLAQRLKTAVGAVTLASAFSGGLLWILFWWPLSFRASSALWAVLTLVVLLGPAAVLGLFYLGLYDLIALPDRVSEHASRTVEASTEAYRAATAETEGRYGWLRRLLLRVWSLRSLLLEHRMLLLRYGAMLRMLTPAFLALVLLAGILSLPLIVIAAGAVLIVVLVG